ncbi:MAG: ABC transporter ATP-binding protein [Gemmatimonadaceae bacterium]
MSVIEVRHVTYSYGRVQALRDVDFTVPEGAFYALVGPNGSGKTTLLQLLGGMRRAQVGSLSIFGTDVASLSLEQRGQIGYLAEGQSLPGWMRLEQLEAFLAPLYPSWDAALAHDLRERFDLDPQRTIGTLSRGQHMKAALLCTLAPRPKLLIMDEPFTGMDALVKDELVRGLLETSGSEGWTVLLCSHDIGELEALADWVAFLAAGRLELSESMESLQARYRHVTLVSPDPDGLRALAGSHEYLSVDRSGGHATFIAPAVHGDLAASLRQEFPAATHVEVRNATLKELFVALARRSSGARGAKGVAA